MALIIDPDSLNQGTEVTINTGARTVTLSVAGNLSADGVTHKALYSFLKEEWKNDANLIEHPFPCQPITDEQFEWGVAGGVFNGWKLANDSSRNLIRTAGWREYDSSGSTLREYAGIITLGSVGATDQLYHQQADGGAAANFTYDGALNEPLQIFGDSSNGNFNRRGYLKIFARVQGKVYDQSELADIGVTSLTYQAYRFPLSNSTDLNISTADSGIDANSDGSPDVSPFSNVTVTYLAGVGFSTWAGSTVYPANSVVQSSGGRWFITTAGGTSAGDDSDLAGGSDTGITWTAYTGERQIGTSYYAFNKIIDANNGTAAITRAQIYEVIQYLLRQDIDIDAGSGTVTGETADLLLEFVGDNLITRTGVYIDDFNANDTNNIVPRDIGGTQRAFPFTASLTIAFNANLVSDGSAIYRVFFSYLNQQTATDVAISSASGVGATISTTNINLSAIANNDYFTLEGFSNVANNGIWQATSSESSNAITANKIFPAVNPVNETAGESITFEYKPFGTADAVLVDDNTGTDIAGNISASSVTVSYDYDANVQRGSGTAGTLVPITVVGIGLSTAQYIIAEGEIARSNANSVTLVSPLERNYQNPS